LKIAQKEGIHHTEGVDLVAMNVNDLLTSGAEPLAFLDYIATGKIELEVLKRVMDGIVEGCRLAQVPLVGGETAEMPDFYPEGVYDLAGFCVGACEKEKLVTGQGIRPGDLIIGLPSSGLHSNGYSLVRKILQEKGISYEETPPELGRPLWQVLLEPTRIYTKEVQQLKTSGIVIKGMAHITGGGIPGNLVRILPEGCRARVELSRVPSQPVFGWIQSLGGVSTAEMCRTFNMGVGYIVVVERREEDKVLSLLKDAFLCGYVEEGKRDVLVV
ncbi:MAG: phosphoribosylformylglycinamidine cyclo-ligase, partial [Aquificaceae bacterium]|nr:phosphoribosylformylglycinamidine cyclo-ligase [Aquificaceae bacterium]